MATSQFCSVCMAHDSIRACRAFLLASPGALSCSFLHRRAAPIVHFNLEGRSGHGPSWRGGPHFFACRALSSIGSSSRSKKAAPTSQNPREEIRKLDEEIRRLEKERRSVGKPKRNTPDMSGKKASAPYERGASSRGNNLKLSSVGNAKFASSMGSSGGTSARALARYEQDDAEEEEEDGYLQEMPDHDDDDDDDVIDEDDEELGRDFSSDAEISTDSSDTEDLSTQVASNSANLVSQKPDTDPSKTIDSNSTGSSEVGTEDHATQTPKVDLVPEVSKVDVVDGQSGHIVKHPWNEWNDFYDVLAQKNYIKDVLPDQFSTQGERYLQFQSSTPMKRAILDFSRERDDIIRFLTKKHIKTVVAVGCPSTERKVVNSCKRLRVLCEIPEDEVCQQCKLKTFCTRAFAAPSPDLMAETVDVARVLYSFALNASPIAESQVSYPINVIKSACHLVNEIVQLSAYPKDPGLPALKSRLPVKQPIIEKRSVDTNHHAGDWNCPECNFRNFAKNRQCRECGMSKGSGKQLEPGDWECPECSFVNFRRNRECRECSASRPSDAGGNEPSLPGEWKCPECHFTNFRRNTECHKCSTKRPKGNKLFDDEDLEPGDWLCPECNFKNFKRNKNCKECGTISPDQGKRDERWGLKKSVSSGGWGSTRGMSSARVESRVSGGRMKHEEWKPDFSKRTDDDSDNNLEEDADLVFGLDGDDDDEGISKSFHGSENRTRAKRGISHRKEVDDELPSDFDLSDFDDLPKASSKKSERKGKTIEDVEEDEDEDDDDNDMEEELSEDERSEPKPGSKLSRGNLEKWEDATSDEDELPISRAASKGKPGKGGGLPQKLDDIGDISRASMKRKPAKGRGLSRNWDDSDDDDDDNFSFSRPSAKSTGLKSRGSSQKWDETDDDEDSDDDDDDDDVGFGGRKRRGVSGGGSSKLGMNETMRDGRLGRFRGRGRGGSYNRGGSGGHSSKFSESDDDGDFTSTGRGAGIRRFGARGNGRGQHYGGSGRSQGRGRHDSNFSASDDDVGFSTRGRGASVGRYTAKGNGSRGSSQEHGFRGRGRRGRGRGRS